MATEPTKVCTVSDSTVSDRLQEAAEYTKVEWNFLLQDSLEMHLDCTNNVRNARNGVSLHSPQSIARSTQLPAEDMPRRATRLVRCPTFRAKHQFLRANVALVLQ